MIDLDESIIQKIKDTLNNENKIENVILFGSRAKNTANKGSDIDLALVGNGLNFKDLCRIANKLDELELANKIDVVLYHTISNENLKEHIDRVGIKLLN